ncbi:hypothetical protein OAM69_07970 [bacterium]|nr:hypothetical protein [bacterium]
MNRRQFLKSSGAGLGVAAGFASNLASLNAYAADISGYKALVCVFLRGGMDSHDMVIPYDLHSSGLFEDIRAPIIDGYATSWTSRRRAFLLELAGTGANASNGSLGDGREFAFPEEMRELRDLYQQNRVAIVGNVGPLIEPVNVETYNTTARVPPRLYSHNDQQSTWMASSAEGATEGWGGRFGDIMAAASANDKTSFTTVSTFGTSVFVNGFNVSGFNLSSAGEDRLQQVLVTYSYLYAAPTEGVDSWRERRAGRLAQLPDEAGRYGT